MAFTIVIADVATTGMLIGAVVSNTIDVTTAIIIFLYFLINDIIYTLIDDLGTGKDR
jgi:hypothetical protein